MRQSDHEYEEWSFGDIQRAIDFENSINDLEAQLYYRRLSPKEVAQQVLRATCQFYDADWCGLIQVDLDLSLWTPFWWFNTGATDKTTLLTEEYESAEFLDRWVQAVRKGIPMVVLDAEVTKEAYPAEYNLYQRLGIRSVIAVSLEPRPVALLAVRNPKRYIQQTSMLRILAYVLLASYNEQKMLNRLQMANIPTSIQNSKDIYVSLFGELSISTSKGVLKEADFNSPRISRLISYLRSPAKMLFLHRRSPKHSGRMIQTSLSKTSRGWFTVYARSSVSFRMSHWFYPPHPDTSSTRNSIL